jgi:hypothetical protein
MYCDAPKRERDFNYEFAIVALLIGAFFSVLALLIVLDFNQDKRLIEHCERVGRFGHLPEGQIRELGSILANHVEADDGNLHCVQPWPEEKRG